MWPNLLATRPIPLTCPCLAQVRPQSTAKVQPKSRSPAPAVTFAHVKPRNAVIHYGKTEVRRESERKKNCFIPVVFIKYIKRSICLNPSTWFFPSPAQLLSLL
ncbi:hypothetical protein SLE2022_195290 [Rubroshorea leprosula]